VREAFSFAVVLRREGRQSTKKKKGLLGKERIFMEAEIKRERN